MLRIRTSEDPQPKQISFGTPLQMGIDSAIGTAFPGWQRARMEARARVSTMLHQYAGAKTGIDRNPPQPLRNPDSPMAQSDAHQMQRRAQDQGRDNAFIGHLADQYRMYGFGDIQYIPNTGNKAINQKYRTFWRNWMKQADAQGRFHFVDMVQLAITGTIYNGRHGFIHHHNEDGTFQVQSVMGYNIGNPRTVQISPNNIAGTVIDNGGRVIGYDLYRLGISGTVHFVQRVPAVIFSCLNPVESADEYAAKTPLHAILNDAHDMKRVENAWMKKIQWAAYKTAVVNVPNATAPDPNEGLDPITGATARGHLIHQLPGEVMYGEDGFEVEFPTNPNPTNNENDYLLTKLAQIAMALNLPLPFVWVMMGLPGTYTRIISDQAKHVFRHGPMGQKWFERTALDDIKKMALFSGIVTGDIPWVDNWNEGYFLYPAHPTADAGEDSQVNLNENRQGVRSMARITGEDGLYWEDVDEQLANEAENKLILAQRTSDRFNLATGQDTTWRDTMPFIQSLSVNPPTPAETESAASQQQREN